MSAPAATRGDSRRHARKASIVRAVGATQLTVPGIQGQPDSEGSKRTWRSNSRNFHRHNQCDSRPCRSASHSKARSAAFCVSGSRKKRKANRASAVWYVFGRYTFGAAPQAPDGSCWRSRDVGSAPECRRARSVRAASSVPWFGADLRRSIIRARMTTQNSTPRCPELMPSAVRFCWMADRIRDVGCSDRPGANLTNRMAQWPVTQQRSCPRRPTSRLAPAERPCLFSHNDALRLQIKLHGLGPPTGLGSLRK